MFRHAPLDATADGALFVERKFVTGGAAYLQQNLVHAAQGFLGYDGRHFLSEGRLTGHFLQQRQHFLDRQDMGGVAGGDGALRHAVVFGSGGFLHHADATGAQDGAQAERAIGGGAREDDADGFFRLILGERAQKDIDGHALPAREVRHRELHYPV